MMPITTSVWICVAFLVYYSVFQVFSDFVRAGMSHNSPNRTISNLRTKYQINIRTFQKNNNLGGFAWFKTIWLNENLFKNESRLLFAFHHEFYHVKHNHKAQVLLMRFIFSLLPLLLSFVYWWVFVILLLCNALIIQHISDEFEVKANDYAKTMMANEKVSDKKNNNNR